MSMYLYKLEQIQETLKKFDIVANDLGNDAIKTPLEKDIDNMINWELFFKIEDQLKFLIQKEVEEEERVEEFFRKNVRAI